MTSNMFGTKTHTLPVDVNYQTEWTFRTWVWTISAEGVNSICEIGHPTNDSVIKNQDRLTQSRNCLFQIQGEF